MKRYVIEVSRDELAIIIDALATWPGTKPAEIYAADDMAQTFQALYDREPEQ